MTAASSKRSEMHPLSESQLSFELVKISMSGSCFVLSSRVPIGIMANPSITSTL